METISNSVIIVCLLTAFIYTIKTLAVSTRIVAARTKKIGSSNSIFNMISIFGNLAMAFQMPLLAKTVEKNIANGVATDTFVFRIVILSATFGAILGVVLIPSMQRILIVWVESLYKHQNIFEVLLESIKKGSVKGFYRKLAFPKIQNLLRLREYHDIPLIFIILTTIVYSFTTVSVLASLYAGCLNPSLRVTALSLNGISMGLGTFSQMLFLQPHNATMTDRMLNGSISESYLRKYFTFVVLAQILGTILGQILFVPLANCVVFIADIIKV